MYESILQICEYYKYRIIDDIDNIDSIEFLLQCT